MTFLKGSTGLWLPGSADSNCTEARGVSFYAENGMVCMRKELPDGKEEFKQLAPSEARIRMQALVEVAKRSSDVHGPNHSQSKFYENFIDGYKRAIVAAEEQGPYEDPSSRRDRVNRRPKSFAMPSKSLE